MTHPSTLRIYKGKDKLAEMIAADFAAFLETMNETGETVFIALSGGSTPATFFSKLAGLKPAVNWDLVRIFWVDERCVPPDHPESNFGMTRKLLLDPLGVPETSYFRIRGEDPPEQEAERYGELILDTVAPEMTFPVFDRVFLGLGTDGHTASIFPGQLEKWEEERLCTVGTNPGTGQQRVSFTGHLINAARKVTFLVSGTEKQSVVREIIRSEGTYSTYPASLVRPHNGELEWYLDEDAAGTLR